MGADEIEASTHGVETDALVQPSNLTSVETTSDEDKDSHLAARS